MRKLEVYGYRGGRFAGHQSRMIVATHTKKEAAALFGVSLYEFNGFGAITANPVEVMVAMRAPGRVFYIKDPNQRGYTEAYRLLPPDRVKIHAQITASRKKPKQMIEDSRVGKAKPEAHDCVAEIVCYCGVCEKAFDLPALITWYAHPRRRRSVASPTITSRSGPRPTAPSSMRKTPTALGASPSCATPSEGEAACRRKPAFCPPKRSSTTAAPSRSR